MTIMAIKCAFLSSANREANYVIHAHLVPACSKTSFQNDLHAEPRENSLYNMFI